MGLAIDVVVNAGAAVGVGNVKVVPTECQNEANAASASVMFTVDLGEIKFKYGRLRSRSN